MSCRNLPHLAGTCLRSRYRAVESRSQQGGSSATGDFPTKRGGRRNRSKQRELAAARSGADVLVIVVYVINLGYGLRHEDEMQLEFQYEFMAPRE
jgi:hypothetical protein